MDNNNNNPQGGNGDKNNNRRGGARILITLIFAAIITLIAISSIRSVIDNVKYKETSYTEFYNSVNSGRVSEVNYESDKITYKLRSDEEYNKYAAVQKDCRIKKSDFIKLLGKFEEMGVGCISSKL